MARSCAEDVPALSALNMRLRDDFVDDANAGVTRWNRVLERAGWSSACACRTSRSTAASASSPRSMPIPTATCCRTMHGVARKETMLPSADDNRFVESLMRPVHAPGVFRLLDRAAAHRHRQQAGRLRICEARGVISA